MMGKGRLLHSGTVALLSLSLAIRPIATLTSRVVTGDGNDPELFPERRKKARAVEHVLFMYGYRYYIIYVIALRLHNGDIKDNVHLLYKCTMVLNIGIIHSRICSLYANFSSVICKIVLRKL